MTFTLFDFHINPKDNVFWVSFLYLEFFVFRSWRIHDGALFHVEYIESEWRADLLFWNLLKGLFHDK